MLMLCTLLAGYIELVALHGPDGQVLYANVAEITSIRAPTGNREQHFARGTRCVVFLADGTFLSTRESCDEVRSLIAWRPSLQ